MATHIHVGSASVAQPNTPETDAMATVDHVVSGYYLDNREGWSVVINAADPSDAIEKVRSLDNKQFEELGPIVNHTSIKRTARP